MTPRPACPQLLHSRVLPLLASVVALTCTATGTPATAPIVIEGPETQQIDLSLPDGGLLPVRGAINIGAFRASKASPDRADGKGYTYHHHPDLAVWKGRYYLGWGSGRKDEDIWPARELYSTSTNGRDWSPPSELFPEGLSLPMRLYFFLAPNGRMLAFAGLRTDRDRTREANKGPLVVREITADHQLGPVYMLRPPTTVPVPDAPPAYTSARDAGFVEACRQLLAARVTLETQDYGLLFDPAERNPWHSPDKWPKGDVGTGFWKAASFYHRTDGTVVGVGKAGWTSLSTDEGKTWSTPVIPPTLLTNNAKIWGQRTGDGRYVLVYNPTRRPRHPLALVHGDDGITFGDMRAVQTRFPGQRYAGINKNTGVQYVRGIAEWATDRSIPDAERYLWLTYSANKEDIWVTRIPLPITNGAEAPQWNVYQPKWATIAFQGQDGMTFETREPQDSAEAFQLLRPAKRVLLTAKISAPNTSMGAFDLELLGGRGGARPVRLRFAGDGFLRGIERDKMIEFGQFPAGSTIELKLEAHVDRGVYIVSINGQQVEEAQFAERVPAIERVLFRAWARSDADRLPEYEASSSDYLPTMSDIGPEFDRPAAPLKITVANLKLTAE